MPLKGIPRSLGPQLLSILSRMGHGDELLIADANFPAFSQIKDVLDCFPVQDNVELLKDIIQLMPLDSFAKYQAAVSFVNQDM